MSEKGLEIKYSFEVLYQALGYFRTSEHFQMKSRNLSLPTCGDGIWQIFEYLVSVDNLIPVAMVAEW